MLEGHSAPTCFTFIEHSTTLTLVKALGVAFQTLAITSAKIHLRLIDKY
jgi:hypothetical protein